MKAVFDFALLEVKAWLSHPKAPYQLVEDTIDIGIAGGRVAKIGHVKRQQARGVFSARGLTLLPGLIDTQVHFREPGMEHKEDIQTGSRSALLGGITAFLEMPNTYPPTLTQALFQDKIKRAEGRAWCDFGFFIGAGASNLDALKTLEKHKGCPGVKIFMGQSTGSLLLSDTQQLMSALKNTTGPIAVHSEDQDRLMERKKTILAAAQNPDVKLHPVWRDEETALTATKRIVQLAEQTQRRVHILHVTTKQEIQFLKTRQNTASVEVTPQHLTLSAPECYEQLGSYAQMNPPIRDKHHQQALWQGVQDGTVKMIGSDHAPHTLDEKQKPYPLSPAGMPGVQTMLPLMLNHVHSQKLSLKKLIELLAVNPCRYYGFKEIGLIKEGFKANFTFVDLKKTQKILAHKLASKCKWSPFENKQITGWPVHVMLKGEWAMRDEEIISPPKGELIAFNR